MSKISHLNRITMTFIGIIALTFVSSHTNRIFKVSTLRQQIFEFKLVSINAVNKTRTIKSWTAVHRDSYWTFVNHQYETKKQVKKTSTWLEAKNEQREQSKFCSHRIVENEAKQIFDSLTSCWFRLFQKLIDLRFTTIRNTARKPAK